MNERQRQIAGDILAYFQQYPNSFGNNIMRTVSEKYESTELEYVKIQRILVDNGFLKSDEHARFTLTGKGKEALKIGLSNYSIKLV